ncbi:MAG: hypothetical protein AB1716_01580 [Planctomycetota bacterium]
MADLPGLGPFDPRSTFLRRLDRKRLVSADGVVSWGAFAPRPAEFSLSFTYECSGLRSAMSLEVYRRAKVLPSGDLPGLCRLSLDDLTARLKPPLPPRSEPDSKDELYGRLHCVTDLPVNQAHMEAMAKLATRNGVVRRFEKH